MADVLASLLRQAPPGEQPQVASSLCVLLGESATVDAALPAAAAAHNLHELLLADVPADSGGGKARGTHSCDSLVGSAFRSDAATLQVMLSPDALLPSGEFLEPRAGLAITFDHVTRAVTAVRPALAAETAPAEVEPFRRDQRACAFCARRSRVPLATQAGCAERHGAVCTRRVLSQRRGAFPSSSLFGRSLAPASLLPCYPPVCRVRQLV